MLALDLLIYADNQQRQDEEARHLMSTLAVITGEASLLREWIPLPSVEREGHSATSEPSEPAEDVTDTGWDAVQDPEQGIDFSGATWAPPTDDDFAYLGLVMDRNQKVTIGGDGLLDLGEGPGEQEAQAAMFAEAAQDREWV